MSMEEEKIKCVRRGGAAGEPVGGESEKVGEWRKRETSPREKTREWGQKVGR